MNFTATRTTTYTTETCYACGMQFAMTDEFYRRCRNNHDIFFYCPQGHRQHYLHETTEQRLLRERDDARSARDSYKASRDTAWRSAAAHKGQVTRIKRKVAKGECPCCKETFKDLKSHMEGQHPEWEGE